MWDGTDLLIEDYGRKSVGRERNGGYCEFRCKGFLIPIVRQGAEEP